MSAWKTAVSVVRCEDYNASKIRSAIIKHFDNLGGIERFICKGDTVVIKPNLICPAPIDQPAQTHPSVILETAKLMLEVNAKPMVCDSTAWADAKTCLSAIGILDELNRLNIEVKDLNSPRYIKVPYADVKVGISSVILDADKVINLPKFKAHQQMTATIAVKNMFGCVSGKKKAIWHFRKGKTHEDFSKLLLGVYAATMPTLNIVDAVVAMEGQGPINGQPREVGLLLASQDAFALEKVCAQLISLEPQKLPVLSTAAKLGISNYDLSEIEILGDDYKKYILNDFLYPQLTPLRFTLPRILKSMSKQLLIQTSKLFNFQN